MRPFFKLVPAIASLFFLVIPQTYANLMAALVKQMPVNSWARANQNQFSEVWTPLEQRPTHWSPGSNIIGFSGAAWGGGRLWIYGGNIGKEYGNEVYAFEASTLTWKRMSLPSETMGDGWEAADAIPVDGLWNAPRSGESWDNLAYLPNMDRFAVIDASFNGGSFDTGPYLFDPAKADPNKVGGTDGSQVNPSVFSDVVGGRMWENREFTQSSQPVGATSAYANINGQDVVYYSNGGRNYDLWEWVVSPDGAQYDTWTRVGDRNGGEVSYAKPGAGAFAPSRNLFARKSAEKLIYWDVGVGGAERVAIPSVSGPGRWPEEQNWGMDYDANNDVFLLWNGGRELWMVEPPDDLRSGDWIAARLNPTGEAPNFTQGPGIFGKWNYMPEYGAFIGVADSEGNVYVYKPGGQPGPAPSNGIINFNERILGPYGGGQDVRGEVSVEDRGATLHITGNRWKQIRFPYEITPDTVLEFEFSSSYQGEIHGIGFDRDLKLSSEFAFQVYGTQRWGNRNTGLYAGNGRKQTFVIPVGQYYTGPMQYLFFAMDHDKANPRGESRFSNIRVYEHAVEMAPPLITSSPKSHATANIPYYYDDGGFLEASGSGPITFSLQVGPEGMSVSPDGFVTWTPTQGQEGDHRIDILAENAVGSRAQSFVISVNPASADGLWGVGARSRGMPPDASARGRHALKSCSRARGVPALLPGSLYCNTSVKGVDMLNRSALSSNSRQ
jgi:hypothetical protein